MRRSILYTLIIFCLGTFCSVDADAQKLYLKRAATYMEQFDFQSAIEIYNIVLKKHPENLEAISGLAKSYRLTNDLQNAEKWYAKLCEQKNPNSIDLFYYAQSLQANQKYSEAKEQFTKYNKIVPEDRRAPAIIMGINRLDDLRSEDPLFATQPTSINSAANDFAPTFYNDGIVFASNRQSKLLDRTDVWTGYSFVNVYYASSDESGLQEEELLKGKVPNNVFHDGPVAFSSDYKVMYLTRSNYIKKKAYAGDDKTVNLKLYRLEYSEKSGKWENIEDAFPFNSSEYSIGHACLSPDNAYLYFMSDMPGGYGESDLYRSKKEGNSWGNPENLGPEINTPGREMFPFIDGAGNLYFSSDGHMGLGGLDLYFSGTTQAGFNRVVHLGTPLNSNGDDFGIVLDHNSADGYFSSNRSGGEGKDDIYKFVRNGLIISGLVTDRESLEPLQGVNIDLFTSTELDNPLSNSLSNPDGSYLLIAKPNTEHKLIASKKGYFPKEIDFKTAYDPITYNISLKKRDFVKLNLSVIDKKSGLPISGAKVEITNTSDGTKEVMFTDEEGKLTYKMLPDKDFNVIVSKEIDKKDSKYLTVSKDISTIDYFFEEINEEFELDLVKLEVPIVLENIFYDFDQWFIRRDAEKELRKLKKILDDNPSLHIELSSHADSRGIDEYNLTLTAKRATSVVLWLTKNGIDKKRMKAVGYGETKLVNECKNEVPCSEAKHQQNRRTEFKILKF